LLQLLESVSKDHPHHSLGVILSLANANIDAELVKVKARKSDSSRLSRGLREDADAEEVQHNSSCNTATTTTTATTTHFMILIMYKIMLASLFLMQTLCPAINLTVARSPGMLPA